MKIRISDFTYIVLLLAFLSGYFEIMYILLITIFIHESGHYFFGYLVNFKFKEIIIYPFGGLTVYDEELNISIYKEFIMLLGGICFQILFFLLVYFLYSKFMITDHVFNIVKKVNILLISFNFLPILPLDGGRVLNILLDTIFPYKKSYIITIIISIVFSIIFLILNKTLFALVLFLYLMKELYFEIININKKYIKFLFERYNKVHLFNKIKNINNISNFKRDYYHIINGISEKKYLSKLFDRNQ